MHVTSTVHMLGIKMHIFAPAGIERYDRERLENQGLVVSQDTEHICTHSYFWNFGLILSFNMYAHTVVCTYNYCFSGFFK